ncbi:MAG: homocysteine S-methyltransferase family protein [Phycisphaerae bacterium]
MAADRSDLFRSLLEQRVVVFDGAMGTSIHALELPLSDYRNLENGNEILNLTRPDAIEGIHRGFLEIGCDAVETNTFGGMKHVLAEFGLADRTHEINLAAARVARRAANAFSTPGWPRFAAGSLGPGTKLVSLRQISYDELHDSYFTQSRGLLEGGVDVMVIETCQDILQAKCVIHAVLDAMRVTGRRVPLMASVTMETTGTMLVGTDIAAALTAIEAYPEVEVIGLNCATGPQEMSEYVRYLAGACTRKLSVMPNAGLPQLVNGQPHFPLSPAELARWLREFVEVDGVNIVGGCCGTTPEHLRAVVQALREANAECRMQNVEGKAPPADLADTGASDSAFCVLHSAFAPRKRVPTSESAVSSLYQSVPLRQDNSFLIVGERCNTNGSRKFKQLLADGDFDGCVAMAVEQVKDEGAHVIDVCVDYVGRDGVPDMHHVVERFSREVTAPLMLDSTQLDVLEAGLKLAGGKCIINSVNLEDGEEKLARVAGLCRQYGAAVVALTIDDDPVEAMAKTADRKLAVAERIHALLTEKHGLREEDILWDCLTFPITTGNDADRRLALETLDGIERVMRRFPRCQSILGLSNVSFGLQPLARVVLNSVFLHEARQRGLTAAIVHPGKILPRTQISDERWNAALDLIYDRRESGDPLTRFIGLFAEGESLAAKKKLTDLPVEERLKQRIIDGNRAGIDADLEEARARYAPLEIINTFLLDGMKVVGELFGSGQMQLPFVLKSAEAMKTAVAALEPFMERAAGSSRGRIVLATVRGDVHDIGKNLVDIILTNNGYTVYNLGIKQPIANVIAALHEHHADAIGLSGLLVKSTLVMRDDLHVLNEQQITVPVILGGAALTRRYVEEDLRAIYKGPLHYAKDAFDGLHLMGQVTGEAGADAARRGEVAKTAAVSPRVNTRAAASGATATVAPPPPSSNEAIPASPGVSAPAARAAKNLSLEMEQRIGLAEVADSEELDAERAGVCDETPQRPASSRQDYAPGPRRGEGISDSTLVPRPPFWGSRVIESLPLRAVLAFINEVMLFQVQWAFRKKGRTPEQFKRYIDLEVRPIYRALVERCEREQIIMPQAVYGYWPCNSDGDDLIVYEPSTASAGSIGVSPVRPETAHRPEADTPPPGSAERRSGERAGLRELVRFTFPRQSKPPHWCLSDFWRPASAGVDVVAFQIVTAGRRVSEVARQWFAANEYQQYLFLHGLGVETAEAAAEYLHKQIRGELGVGGADARDMPRLFQQGYQGSRYSFGYPACPRLEDQEKLMKLLKPERVDITLSEEFQLDPEQSTSAIVAHHPAARYFNVR